MSALQTNLYEYMHASDIIAYKKRSWRHVTHNIHNFLDPNGIRFARCYFRAQKSLDFQGPTLPMAHVIDVARIKIITSRAL